MAASNWRNITPPGVAPWSKIAQIDASRFDDNSAYVAVNRMRVDDLRPYIYRTHDGGKGWVSISAGLPDDAPVNAVRADPVQPGLLYAATEHAVWTSFDDGAHWRAVAIQPAIHLHARFACQGGRLDCRNAWPLFLGAG